MSAKDFNHVQMISFLFLGIGLAYLLVRFVYIKMDEYNLRKQKESTLGGSWKVIRPDLNQEEVNKLILNIEEFNEKWSNLNIAIHKSEVNDKEHYLTKLARKIKEINKACEKLLPVPDLITKPHPLIKGAKLNLNAQKKTTSWRGLPVCIETRGDLLSISVQRHNVKRSLRIMDTIIKMAELRGHKIIVEYRTTKIIVLATA